MGDESYYLEDGADYYDIYGYDGECDMNCRNCEYQADCDEFSL